MANQLPTAHPAVAFGIDDGAVGDVRSITGLEMQADVVTTDLGPDVQKKHVSNIYWAPGVVTLGMDIGKALAAWLGKSFSTGYATANGSITLADINGRAALGVTFENALIARCSLLTLDVARKRVH